MSARDARGCAVTGATPEALERYESALRSLRLQRGDALAQAREASALAPMFAAAHLLEGALLLGSRDHRDFEEAGWVYARLRYLRLNEREMGHAAALAAAVDGDFARGGRFYDAVLAREPRDEVALHAATVFDYYLGNPAATRERTARVLPHWSADLPGYHGVLAVHAFGLEECGEYAQAGEAALHALELEPLDLRAHHAMTHVFEMQGRAEEGIRWMGSRSAAWAASGRGATHLWWHLALHHLQLGRTGFALQLYDRRLRAADSLPGMIDASALLWRLHLAGADTAVRFRALAGAWASHAEDRYCAFNDLHAMMAFAGAGRHDLQDRLLRALEERVAARWSTNHDMTRLVGLPACRALRDFGRGEFGAAEAALRALPPVAHRIGGSHAQRDILQITRAAASEQARRSRHAWLRREPRLALAAAVS